MKAHTILLSALLLCLITLPSLDLSAAIYVKIPGVPGDARAKGYDNGEWFVAESFSFGVEREDRESGEKGGTEDINIGVGELQEISISKSLDGATARLAQFAINGNSPGTAEIHFVESVDDGAGGTRNVAYMVYKLDRCFVKSWSTSGDADDRPTEDISLYFNRIAFVYFPPSVGGPSAPPQIMTWDNVVNKEWSGHNLPTSPPTGGK